MVENLFESRFKIVNELSRMGANITIKDRMAIINGVNKLYGASVVATDLRGGAGLVLAGLVAKGKTTIDEIFHIERGYYNFDKNLKSLGANIDKVEW